MPPIECESTENQQNYLKKAVLLDYFAIFAVVLTTNSNRIMIEEKNIWVIHYFSMRLDTGEIKDKIWLYGNYQDAKNLYNTKKSMIDRTIGKKPRIVEFEKRNYYNVEVEAPGNGFDNLTTIIYTLIIQRKKVQLV